MSTDLDIVEQKPIDAAPVPAGGSGHDDHLRYRLALEAARIGTWSWEAATDQVSFDPRVRELLALGDETSRSTGELLSDIVHPHDRRHVRAALREAVAPPGDGRFESEFRVVRPDGSECWLRAVGRIHFQGEGALRAPVRILGVVVDITDHILAVLEIERARERSMLLQALTAALAKTYTPEEVAEVVVAEGIVSTGAQTGIFILRESPTSDDCLIIRDVGVLDRLGQTERRIPLSTSGPAAECIRTGNAFFLETREAVFQRFPGMTSTFERLGTHALAAVPLRIGNTVVGSMSFTFGAARSLPLEDREFFLALADEAAQAIERSRLLESERNARAEVEQLNRELRSAIADLHTVLDVVPIGIGIARDADCVDIRVNPAFAGQLGITPDMNASKSGGEGPGLPFRIMQDSREVPPDMLPMQRAAREGVTLANIEYDIVHLDGRVTRLLEFASPLRDSNGRVRGAVGAFVDITERDLLIQAEREARAEAEQASRAKSEFLAVMSHELRTPLNAIGGYADLLAMEIHGPITEQQRQDLDRLQRSQKHLLGLINELLDYARLETGSVAFAMESVPVASAVNVAESLIAPQVRAKGLTLDIQQCNPDVMVQADPEKLSQVLLNLLSNAVKFTDSGGTITVTCTELPTSAGGEPMLEIAVRDTGIGIGAEDHDAIFEPFVQIGRALNRPAEGTGLGLAISRDLARGMGGDVTTRSSLGAGAEFLLTLPRARSGQQTATADR